jgi:hypothetical protein
MIPRCCSSCSNDNRSNRNSADDSCNYNPWDRLLLLFDPPQRRDHRNRYRRRRYRPTCNDDVISSSSSRTAFVTFAVAAVIIIHLLPEFQYPHMTVYCYNTPSHRLQHPSSISHRLGTLQHSTNHHFFRTNGETSYRERSTRRFVLTTPEAIIEQASTTKLLDDLIDESVRTSARRPLMMQFDPSSGWIWKRWKGTVFSETWDACVYRMIYACIVFLLCKSFPQTKELLSGFAILWGQLLSVTTFTLTFFVNQSLCTMEEMFRTVTQLTGSFTRHGYDISGTRDTDAIQKCR